MVLSVLLHGYEGQEFWSPIWGDVLLVKIDLDNNCKSQPLLRVVLNDGKNQRNLTRTGKLDYSTENFGRCILWPSIELYQEYPLDSEKAWDIWSNSKKSYNWRAKLGEEYWFINFKGAADQAIEVFEDHNNLHHKTGNYFKTPEEAYLVAVEIKEIFSRAHKKG